MRHSLLATPAVPRTRASAATLATTGLLANAAVWGLSFVLIRDALRGTSVATFLAARFAVASLALAIPLALRGSHTVLWREARAGAGPGLALLAGYALQTLGLQSTTAARGGLITGLSVVFVPPLAHALRGHPLRRRQILALFPATLGLVLLDLNGIESLRPSRGDLLILGCAVAFALQIVLLAPRADASEGAGDSAALTFWQTLYVAVGALALFPITGERLSLAGMAAAVFLGLAGTAGALWVQTLAQRHVSATRVAFAYTFEPLFAALFAVALAGEPLRAATLAGGALIVAAMALGR